MPEHGTSRPSSQIEPFACSPDSTNFAPDSATLTNPGQTIAARGIEMHPLFFLEISIHIRLRVEFLSPGP